MHARMIASRIPTDDPVARCIAAYEAQLAREERRVSHPWREMLWHFLSLAVILSGIVVPWGIVIYALWRATK